MHDALNSISLGPPWVEYLLFFVISFTNVFLQNLKYIFLIKSTKLKAALIGMLTSIFYATVVVLIAKHGWISVLIIAGTHFMGIYAAKSVCEWLERKGKLNKKVGVFSHTFRYVSYFFTKNKLFSPSKDF